ncbi:MAG TPA: hypothetical protein VGO93_03400, partial [Candidatus Xenobia bacterium]
MKMTMLLRGAVLSGLLMTLSAAPSWSSPLLVTSNVGFCPADHVDCFSTLVPQKFYTGTECMPNGASITTFGATGYINYTGFWGLGCNFEWLGRTLIGECAHASPGTPLVFTFTCPVSQVGGFMNYTVPSSLYGCTFLTALNSACVVIANIDLSTTAPICTRGAVNGGAFRGFTDTT